MSSAIDLYNEIDGHMDRHAHWQEQLERSAIKKADKVYAPSRFVSDHFQRRHGIPLQVLRPPVGLEVIQPKNLLVAFQIDFWCILGS